VPVILQPRLVRIHYVPRAIYVSCANLNLLQGFIKHLKDHLLSRIHGHAGAGEEREFSTEDHNALLFQHDRIYKHAFL
jgi:hypothetical protein